MKESVGQKIVIWEKIINTKGKNMFIMNKTGKNRNRKNKMK